MSDFKKLSAYVDVPCEWVSAAAPRNDKLDQLKAENAKLRELVQQMYPIAKAQLRLGVTLGCNDTMSYDWALQMIELGVEVNE